MSLLDEMKRRPLPRCLRGGVAQVCSQSISKTTSSKQNLHRSFVWSRKQYPDGENRTLRNPSFSQLASRDLFIRVAHSECGT